MVKIQDQLKSLFSELLNIFDKYNIEYWATGATLIGCMRHKDIIPWDDDIDLNITTESIQKLKNAISSKYNDFIYRFI